MPEITTSIEVLCESCGKELSASVKNDTTVKVEPCQDCLDKSYEDGLEKGRQEEKDNNG